MICGDVVSIEVRHDVTQKYSISGRSGQPALILLAGGGGHVDLDEKGCPRKLKGNSLLRAVPELKKAGFAAVIVDAPSDRTGDDGLVDYRNAKGHAADLGKIIASVRARLKGPVWLAGTSRGAISAANAAGRLEGESAPDGLILTSPVTSGQEGARKPWVSQTVFDTRLSSVKVPALVMGHEQDVCPRSPPDNLEKLAGKLKKSPRKQVILISGGPGAESTGLDACEGAAPHGFTGQDVEMVSAIARFIEAR